ncbi:MAG TPA: glutaredoxin family protein, partial [Blastocatellia bacterium]|nr:glutaredoxin family protein [Blastocatellia bacterium]
MRRFSIFYPRSSILKEGNMANVVIYTKPDCPYCAKAMAWHREHSIPFEERNAQDNLKYRKEMFA